MIKINPLYLVIAAQVFFITLGKTVLPFNVSWLDIGAALVTAILAELLFSYLESRYYGRPHTVRAPWSAVAAALGLGIFFRATNPWYFALAALVAIGSKYLIRRGGVHIFNPSNIAIVTMIFAFPSAATVELTQWGNNVWVYLLIAAICFFVAYRADVWLITISFLVSYTVLLFMSLPYHLDILAVHHFGLLGPSLVLFASFMITDPRTTPKGTIARILHGVAVAAGFFLLELWGIKYSLFVASFLTALLGVFSAYGVSFLSQRSGWAIPRNLLTCLLLGGAMSYAYASTITHKGVFSEFGSIAPSFLFMGVESFSITQCSKDPIYRTTAALTTPPAMTTGAAWGDYDRDGKEDIFISNIDTLSKLYRNTPEGFVDMTAQAGLPGINSQSAFFADYDNDGQRDLFVVYGMQDYLAAAQGQPIERKSPVTVIRAFRSLGGRFVEATTELGLNRFALPPSGGTLSFSDYNRDGYLDFVYAERSTFEDISPINNLALLKSLFEPYLNMQQRLICEPAAAKALLRAYNLPALPSAQTQEAFVDSGGCLINTSEIPLREHEGAQSVSGHPFNIVAFKPGSAHVFENRHGQGFVEHPVFSLQLQELFAQTQDQFFKDGAYPYDDISASFYQPVSFDYDSDGQQDILLSIDWGTNLLMRNEGNFVFSNVTAEAGMNYAGSGMGSDVADYNGDGLLDVVAGNIRRVVLFANRGDGTFANEEERYNLNPLGISWGISFLDYDLDGREDLYVGNGSVEVTSNVPWLDLSRPLYRSDKLYRNVTEGRFEDATASAFCPADGKLTRAVAVADFDNDGDPDILSGYFAIGAARTPPQLYVNQHKGRHYLSIELQGVRSPADAAGAVVSVTAAGHTQTKPLLLGNSFYAQNSYRLLFGLGEHTGPVDISVLWPSGSTTQIKNAAVDRALKIIEQ